MNVSDIRNRRYRAVFVSQSRSWLIASLNIDDLLYGFLVTLHALAFFHPRPKFGIRFLRKAQPALACADRKTHHNIRTGQISSAEILSVVRGRRKLALENLPIRLDVW